MGIIIDGAIDAWSTAGAAKALTTSYVAGTAFKSRDADELWLSLVTSATGVTSLDLSVRWSDDGGTTYHELPTVDSISSGVVAVSDNEVEHAGAADNGNHSWGPVFIPSGCDICVYAKRTGGDATSALVAKATIIRNS